MSKKLTPAAIDKLKPDPAGKRREIPDAGKPGLRLVIQPSGKKSFAVRYRLHGRQCKFTLPGSPSLATARVLAQQVLDRVAAGIDPATERREQRAKGSERTDFESVLRDYLQRHTRRKDGRPIRDSSRREAARLLGLRPDPKEPGNWVKTGNGVLARFGGRDLGRITKIDVQDLIDTMLDRGPVTANRTLATLKTFFNWAVRRDLLLKSPADDIDQPAPEKTRERVLSGDELAALWHAADRDGYPYGPLVQLLILTGCRRDEVRGARWQEIDRAEALWTIPAARTKNGREHRVPLAALALDVLKAVPKIGHKPELLFTTTGSTKISGLSRAKNRLHKAMAAELGRNPDQWSLHDLRRTFVTGLQKLRFPQEVCEACVNHKGGTLSGVAGIYARHDFAEEKKSALDAWARHVGQLASGEAAKIVAMRPHRRSG